MRIVLSGFLVGLVLVGSVRGKIKKGLVVGVGTWSFCSDSFL